MSNRIIRLSLGEVLINLALEEVVHLRLLSHLLLPGGASVFLGAVEDVSEIIEGENACAFVEDEEREEIKFHVDFGSKPNDCFTIWTRLVLHYEEFVLQTNEFFAWWRNLKLVAVLIN
jgi:hypothetical protein